MKLKNLICAGLVAIAPSVAVGQEAVSDIVGYVTETIQPGFNLIGVTLHGNKEASGTFTGVSGTTLTDSTADYTTFSGTYILEITSGTASGTIQEISSYTTNAITTPQDLSSEIAVGDTYVLREASTLGSIFGVGGDVTINKGNSTTGDLVYIPNGSGGFDVYFHTEDSFLGDGSWSAVFPATGGADAPIVYTDAILVENKSTSSYDLVIEGAVKATSTQLLINEPFTYIANPYPAATTLDSSGLADVIGKGNTTTADLVYVQNATGAFDVYYHSEDSFLGAGSWNAIFPATGDGSTPLEGGLIIQKRGSSFTTDSSAPTL